MQTLADLTPNERRNESFRILTLVWDALDAHDHREAMRLFEMVIALVATTSGEMKREVN